MRSLQSEIVVEMMLSQLPPAHFQVRQNRQACSLALSPARPIFRRNSAMCFSLFDFKQTNEVKQIRNASGLVEHASNALKNNKKYFCSSFQLSPRIFSCVNNTQHRIIFYLFSSLRQSHVISNIRPFSHLSIRLSLAAFIVRTPLCTARPMATVSRSALQMNLNILDLGSEMTGTSDGVVNTSSFPFPFSSLFISLILRDYDCCRCIWDMRLHYKWQNVTADRAKHIFFSSPAVRRPRRRCC